MKRFLCSLLCFATSVFASNLDPLYNSLDPTSISQLFAFYELYPDSNQGKKAMQQAWKLMNQHRPIHMQLSGHLMLPFLDVQALTALVNRQPHEPIVELNESQLDVIEGIADHLWNRLLKGHKAWKTEDVIALESEEIDLARALFLYEFPGDRLKVRQYEASLDLMALQILARLEKGATDLQKITAINHFIFHEMRFRFPPHSLWPKNVDTYTLLPSILDSRQGVCLGVSILYLSLAQRLDLPLEIITPPGHIYVRYHKGDTLINIETTARGIHMPSETYLGVNTRSLQERTLKQVVGFSFVNQAAVAWHREDHAGAIKLYENALPYIPDDYLLHLFLGMNHLFLGNKKEGEAYLKKIKDQCPEENVIAETLIEDYFTKRVDANGLKIVYMPVDEKRASILEKQEEILQVLKKYPKFRDGQFHLAITYLQLGRGKEALEALETYHKIFDGNPTVEYYMAALSLERQNYPASWVHVKKANEILKPRNHDPKCMKALEHELRTLLRDGT